MLNAENSLLLGIDVQEKLVDAIGNKDIVPKSEILVKSASILKIPEIFTEQYPKGLGKTIQSLKLVAGENNEYFSKTSFNALNECGFLDLVKRYDKSQIVVFGIETHICVFQTACALIEQGFEVFVAKDACSSRKPFENKQGLSLMKQYGAKISCVETILFEWLKDTKNSYFKEIQALIK